MRKAYIRRLTRLEGFGGSALERNLREDRALNFREAEKYFNTVLTINRNIFQECITDNDLREKVWASLVKGLNNNLCAHGFVCDYHIPDDDEVSP